MGNLLRALRLSRGLPFLLQAAMYRHLDALRAAVVAAAAAASTVGGIVVPLPRLAALLCCRSSPRAALQLCSQLPCKEQQPQVLQQQQDIVGVRLSRGGQIAFVSSHSAATDAAAATLHPRSYELPQFAGCTYSDAWLRLPPPEAFVSAMPRSRAELRRLLLGE